MPPPLRTVANGLVRSFPRPAPTSGATVRTSWLAGLQTHANTIQTQRTFANTTARAAGSAHHESPYDPPGGWLFGVKPGEKYQNEGWERIFVWGFWGTLLVSVVAYAYKPDSSIQTWALEEARRRLEAEGILPDPATSKDSS